MSSVPNGRRTEPTERYEQKTRAGHCGWILAWLGVLMAGPALAQHATNLRLKYFAVAGDTLTLDTVSIAPGSVDVFANGLSLSAADFVLDPFTAKLTWRNRPLADSVLVRYRTLPMRFAGVRQHKDPDRLLDVGDERIDPFRYVPPRHQGDPMGIQGLSKTGSISRGILFGNNQDLAVNSTLNLELSGPLTERINVLASITDNNIPIQAGGNTLELQDFDQVFIKLYEEDPKAVGNLWELTAGDMVLQRPRSHFLTYMKKTKGLAYGTRLGAGASRPAQVGASAAISKGKFARNLILGSEGVQGPYRLQGNAGELFIVVLSGTERIFIDGQQLIRGQENDYVIDYNTAEVTFTARRMITKDRRITAEYQYSDKNYMRSLLQAETTVPVGNSTFRFSLFSEQDHRNQPLQQQLSEEEREVLSLAGDNPLAAIVPGVDSTGFATDQVLYRLTDSLGYSPVYVYSTDPELAVYRITFTQVGAGLGDYVQDGFTPNGRLFRWVEPDPLTGVRRGDHAPVRVLIAPRSQQLITLGGDHVFSPRTKANIELAVSNNDLNTFSTLDEGDDLGIGLLLGGDHAIPLTVSDTSLQLMVGATLESVSRNFRFVERYRTVEFERNWNLPTNQAIAANGPLDGDQLLSQVRVGVQGRNLGQFAYGLNNLHVNERYTGWKHDLTSNLRAGRYDLLGTGSWLNTTQYRPSTFQRHKATIRHRFNGLTLGYKDELEHNRFKVVGTDSLSTGSYQFYDWEAFVQSPDTARTKWRLSAGQRYEKALRQGSLTPSTRATAYGLNLDLTNDPRNRLTTAFTYRSLMILDSALTVERPKDTYLARLDHHITLWKGALGFSYFYEFGSGLEQRREYIYIEVPAGQGLYVWIDYNTDGIKDLNEFELANFSYEANYLRIFVPSNTYVRVFSNQFSTSVDIRPAAVWSGTTGTRRFLARFSDNASYRVDRKTGLDDLLVAINPFADQGVDTSLAAYNASARNTFYYDRTSRIWSVDHTWQSDRARSLLLNGYESRSRQNNILRLRVNLGRRWTMDLESDRGRVSNSSDLLDGRTYTVDQQGLRPRLTWQPNTSVRAVLYVKHTNKQNLPEFGDERSTALDLGTEFRYNTAGKGSILVTTNLVDIDFRGVANSPLGNELLSGLKPGTNVTWSVSVQRNLSNNLQVDLTYNGRRSEGTPVVHVGGAQVRAFF